MKRLAEIDALTEARVGAALLSGSLSTDVERAVAQHEAGNTASECRSEALAQGTR
jgi:hypothetical protein